MGAEGRAILPVYRHRKTDAKILFRSGVFIFQTMLKQ